MSDGYVHGYSAAEASRLLSQAGILAEFIHGRAQFAPGSRILEAGCGVGAQTVELAARNPHSTIVAIDLSADSLRAAQTRVASRGLRNVQFRLADLYELPFDAAEFDAAFICFVLEHLALPLQALREILRVLRRAAKVQVFEGDHGSTLAWPNDAAVVRLVTAVSKYQSLQGGDACIGRGLCPILQACGLRNVTVEPCIAYSDETRPRWVEEFAQATFIDMMQGQREAVLARGLLSEIEWHAGIEGLNRAARHGGSFSYTFYRATGER
jgi:SAM-dependent methyltransferase